MLSLSEVNFIVGYLTIASYCLFFFFLCFLVRVRCRPKKFTFAISSADEFLVNDCRNLNTADQKKIYIGREMRYG